MIFSMKIKLNHNKNISEELGCVFGVVGKILRSRILWSIFYKFWIEEMVEILNFK
jgi:hypothetical protein